MQSLSVSPEVLRAPIKGKSVAIIGNARALAACNFGGDIDQHDIVIRINRAPMPAAASHGTKTDWLALATRLPRGERARLSPSRILWMSHKRKRLDYTTAHSAGFYLHPLSCYHALAQKLGAQPTTGAMIIELVAQSDAAQIDLYGFDFFSSLSLSGRRTAEQVPHEFSAEEKFVRDLIARDPRITLHTMK